MPTDPPTLVCLCICTYTSDFYVNHLREILATGLPRCLQKILLKPFNADTNNFYTFLQIWSLLWFSGNGVTNHFDILMKLILCRFSMPPQITIYDNGYRVSPFCFELWTCCFSGQVLLARTLGMFQGYSLDSYTLLDIASINSQVNGQANARLQRIKGDNAYMKPDNFIFHIKLYLGLQNRDK